MRYGSPRPVFGDLPAGRTYPRGTVGGWFRAGQKHSAASLKERVRRRHKLIMELRKQLPPNFNFTVLFDMSTPELLQVARETRRMRTRHAYTR